MTNKEAYNKGYKDGQEALAYHLELCKEEAEPCDSIINTIDFAIDATTGKDNYSVGMRNGLRYSKSLIDRKKPQFESCAEQEPCEDCISRKEVLDLVEDMTDQFGVGHRVITEGVISMLPPVTSKPKTDVLDKIRAEIIDTGAYEQEVNGKTEFLKGINYCLGVIDKYKAENEDKK